MRADGLQCGIGRRSVLAGGQVADHEARYVGNRIPRLTDFLGLNPVTRRSGRQRRRTGLTGPGNDSTAPSRRYRRWTGRSQRQSSALSMDDRRSNWIGECRGTISQDQHRDQRFHALLVKSCLAAAPGVPRVFTGIYNLDYNAASAPWRRPSSMRSGAATSGPAQRIKR